MLTLPVVQRAKGGPKAAALLRAGTLPAVVYGPHQASTAVALDARAFEKILRAAGESAVISLTGLGEDLPVLIHEVDLDPITHLPRHLDFYAVTKGEKVKVAIPLTFVGESEAVKNGANLVKVLHELEIEADPMNLPHDLTVDISSILQIGDRVFVKDIKLPPGVSLEIDADEVVALAQEIVEEKVEEVAPVDLSAIEVEKKGKVDEAEGAAGAEAGETKAA